MNSTSTHKLEAGSTHGDLLSEKKPPHMGTILEVYYVFLSLLLLKIVIFLCLIMIHGPGYCGNLH